MTTTILHYPYTIVNVSRAENGWTAMLMVDDDVFVATRTSGSWAIIDGERRREALPHIARALEDIVYPVELAERRQRRKDAEERERAAKRGPEKGDQAA